MSVHKIVGQDGDVDYVYDTWNEAVSELVFLPIAAGDVDDAEAEYDIDAIARETIERREDGLYGSSVDVDEFWQIVERHAR